MRLCDLDEIKVCVDRQYKNCHGYSGSKKAIYREAILAVKSILHSAKPVDAVEAVRCWEWIPAEEPPKEYRDEYGELIPFLVCEEGTDYPFRAMYDGKTWGDGIFAVPVKWWMHLPTPPKEKERKDGDGNV